MNKALSVRAVHWIKPYYKLGHLLIVETAGKEHEAVTDLITRLALRGPFHLIVGDEWLPDRDTLYRSVRRFTIEVEEILDHPILMRPMTCLQLLDLLMESDMQNKPTLILDFLHHFYNADVDLSLRDRVLEQCCQFTKRLSFSNSVVLLVPRLSTDEYKRFFPLLAAIADEIIEVKKNLATKNLQDSLF
jgi:hypothetical protein